MIMYFLYTAVTPRYTCTRPQSSTVHTVPASTFCYLLYRQIQRVLELSGCKSRPFSFFFSAAVGHWRTIVNVFPSRRLPCVFSAAQLFSFPSYSQLLRLQYFSAHLCTAIIPKNLTPPWESTSHDIEDAASVPAVAEAVSYLPIRRS